jgi:uncharacterized membrane protein YGL010W
MALADVFNLKKQLVQYGSHHYNKTNIIIHMIFVPVIFWTGKFYMHQMVIDPLFFFFS